MSRTGLVERGIASTAHLGIVRVEFCLAILFIVRSKTYMSNPKKKTRLSSELFTRGVEEVIVREHLEAAIRSGKKLRVKFGIDPTSPDLHLGHTVPLRKLRAFQDLGHKAVLIIGDFTAMVGDPSGRSESRSLLTEKDVRANMKHYLAQVDRVLDLKKAEIRHNSEWYKKRGVAFLYDLFSKVTVQRAIERDDFSKRLADQQDVSVLEVIYPLLQGYDSVAVKADVEIGGSDQKFNLLMGRRIQRRYGQKEQDILTTWLIEGTDGTRKMSKSFGNYIGLREAPGDIFGKVMAIPDDLIVKYYTALTDVPLAEVESIKQDMRSARLNPRDAKQALGERIVAMYHAPEAARKAREEFLRVFSRRELPSEVPTARARRGAWDIADLLAHVGLAPSKSEARRLIGQGAVEIDGRRLMDAKAEIKLDGAILLRVGKRKFLKVLPK